MLGPPQLPRPARPGCVVLRALLTAALLLPAGPGLAAPATPPATPAVAPPTPASPAPSTPAPTTPAPPATTTTASAPDTTASAPTPTTVTTPTSQAPAPDATTGPRAAAAARPPAPAGEIPPQPPRDPNDTPFMRAPNNQITQSRLRTSPDLRRGYSSVRRVALTLAPVFASFRLPFLCRDARHSCSPGYDGAPRQHGAGVGGELDVQLIRWLWLRAQGSYSVHPIDDVRVTDDKMNVAVVAPGGTIRALGFGVGPVIAIDLGRFLPLIEGGIGGLRVANPAGLSKGQMGEACLTGGVCDVGLRCGAANTCVQSVIPELYFGGAIDVLVRKHISLGAQFRYTALLSAPGKFPVYLLGGLRLGVRF